MSKITIQQTKQKRIQQSDIKGNIFLCSEDIEKKDNPNKDLCLVPILWYRCDYQCKNFRCFLSKKNDYCYDQTLNGKCRFKEKKK